MKLKLCLIAVIGMLAFALGAKATTVLCNSVPASDTINATTSETAFTTTCSIPANTIAQNTVVRITPSFQFNTGSSTVSFRLRAKLGSTYFYDSGAQTPGSTSTFRNGPFTLLLGGTAAPGASVTVAVGGSGYILNTLQMNQVSESISSIATNGALTISFTMINGGTTTGNSTQLTHLLVEVPTAVAGTPWQWILASNRATDWSTAGVKGGIPSASWTQCGSTISAYTGTADTINNALAHTATGYTTCGSNTYIQLGTGTFTLSSAIKITNSNNALRGMGANSTFLVFNVSSTANLANCGEGDYVTISVCPSGSFDTGSSWSAGYSQGTTQITLSSVTGLSVGGYVILDQKDDASDGWPAAGDIYVCQSGPDLVCSNEGGGGNQAQSGRAETEMHEVTAISGSGPYTVTLADGIRLPNWRTGQTPQASWFTAPAQKVGIENLSLDWTTPITNQLTAISGIEFAVSMDSWIKGVRLIETASAKYTSCPLLNPIYLPQDFRSTVEDSYIYGPSDNPVCVYQIRMDNSDAMLIQNNIIHQGNQPIYTGGPSSGSVIAHNFTPSVSVGGQTGDTHGAGEFMDLWEGNIGQGLLADSTHGSHLMQTQFRNRWSNPNDTTFARNVQQFASNARFMNVIGNVLGDSSYTAYQYSCSPASCTRNDNTIYGLGFSGDYTNPNPPPPQVHVAYDGNVLRTIMRWGNWDYKTNAVRWCGQSGDTGFGTTCSDNSGYGGVASEIPSGITNFPNLVPSIGDVLAGQGPLPASFYLSSKPAWWLFPAGTAAVNYVQSNGATSTSNVSSLAATFSSPQATGNLNVVVVDWSSTTITVNSVTDTAGNTYTLAVGPTQNTGGGFSQSIYYAKNISGANVGTTNTVTVTFSASTAFPDIKILEYQGVDQSSPVDVTAGNTGNSTSCDSGSATTTHATDLIFGSCNPTTSVTGPGTGFTQRILDSFGSIAEDKQVTSTGSYNATAPVSPSGQWIMQMVAFKAASVSSTASPYPAVGPDVTGGNISNTSGHAYENPAMNCYLNVMGGASDGTGTPLTFNGHTCYSE